VATPLTTLKRRSSGFAVPMDLSRATRQFFASRYRTTIPTSRRPAKPAFFHLAHSAVRCAWRPGALSLFARQVTPPMVREAKPCPWPLTTGRVRPSAFTSPLAGNENPGQTTLNQG
jgi:hypothetical protein